MTAVGDSIEQIVIDDLYSTIAAISSDLNEYATTVARVYEMEGDLTQVAELPAVVIIPQAATEEYLTTNTVTVTLPLAILCGVYAEPNNDGRNLWARQVRAFVADVKQAITQDPSRGGYALDTRILRTELFDATQDTPVAGAQVSATITFRHRHNDPRDAGNC